MKKVIRRSAVILLTFCLILLGILPAFGASDVSSSDYLLSCGYEKEFLNEISDSAAEKLVALIGDNEVLSVEKKTEKRVQKSEKDEIEITTVTAKLKEKASDNLSGEVVCVFWHWLDQKPIVRRKNLVLFSWNNDRFTYDSETFLFEDYSRKSSDERWNIENSGDALSKAEQGQIGYWTKTEWFKKQVGAVAIFRLLPAKSLKADEAGFASVAVNFEPASFPLIIALIPVLVLAAVVLLIIIRRKR